MNWRRGLFRLWLVASAAWLALTTVVAYYSGAFSTPLPPVGFTLDDPLADIRLFPVFALTPPLIVGVAIFVLLWVVSGFDTRPQSRKAE
jgi:hypothetical protein